MKKKCKNEKCKNEFAPVNGTAAYCSNKCYQEVKRNRQKIVDDLVKNFRKGIYQNFKIFSELLPGSGRYKIQINNAYKMGFDENAFYGSSKDTSGFCWLHVGDYFFCIKTENETIFLILYKK